MKHTTSTTITFGAYDFGSREVLFIAKIIRQHHAGVLSPEFVTVSVQIKDDFISHYTLRK
jgi:hypothetical protein